MPRSHSAGSSRDCSAEPAVPSTGSVAVDAAPLQGWLQGPGCSRARKEKASGDMKDGGGEGPEEEIKEESVQRELEMAN